MGGSSRLSVSGKTVVVTGTVTGMERKDVEAKLVGLGARVTGSVLGNSRAWPPKVM